RGAPRIHPWFPRSRTAAEPNRATPGRTNDGLVRPLAGRGALDRPEAPGPRSQVPRPSRRPPALVDLPSRHLLDHDADPVVLGAEAPQLERDGGEVGDLGRIGHLDGPALREDA